MSDRLLFLERFLAENTDEETFVSTGRLLPHTRRTDSATTGTM